MRTLLSILLLSLVNVIIYGQALNSGQIGSNQDICYGYAPQSLTFAVQPTGGTPPYTYRWQRSNNGSDWYDITGTTAQRQTYSPPVLGRTAHFRCRVTDYVSASAVTNVASISVASDLIAPVIGNDQTIYNGSAPLPLSQLSAPIGGGGPPYSYQWQSSDDGLYWSNIPGATSSGYSPEAMAEDRWFRSWVIDGTCGSTSSNSVRITVNQITIYTSETPNYRSYWQGYVDRGTEFEVLRDGVITAVRLYTDIAEGGVHQIRLWRENDQSNYDLVAGPINWDFSAGIDGWREFNLPSAINVESNRKYIISITVGANNNWWVQLDDNLIPEKTDNIYLRYIRGIMTNSPGSVPNDASWGQGYFRDVVFIPFSPGSAGVSQSICYNNVPAALTQITPPTGGAGEYTYQWQSSTDGSVWANIQGATTPQYSPQALTISTYYRRVVTSGGFNASGPPVLITVDHQFNSAIIQGGITIYEGTSTFFNINISGGTPPYSIEYTRTDSPPIQISNYVGGTDIYTGILTEGTYEYALTSVTDAFGCEPQSLGLPITITASGSYSGGTKSNKALVIVNSYANGSNGPDYYGNYVDYIKPYLDWFGIPYETCDINIMQLPNLSDYAVIIFGHRAVYGEDFYPPDQVLYPISALEAAISGGVGLYTFDYNLFDRDIEGLTIADPHAYFESNQINIITQPNHYITQLHTTDEFNSDNNIVNARVSLFHIFPYTYDLANSTTLATMTSEGITEPLLQVANYGNGRIVKWNAYNWVFEEQLGPVSGMDDLIWRGIVWAARKPFVMQGIPPMVTMRVDDVDGYGTEIETNLEWLKISNEFGLIPWCGTFIDTQSDQFYSTLRDLVDHNLATASPHAFNTSDYIYYEMDYDPNFNASEYVLRARSIYSANSIKMSKYLVPHAYLLTFEALSEIRNMGIEYIGIPIPYDPVPYPGDPLQCGPYRINRLNGGGSGPIYYGGNVNWAGSDYFISLTEIRDEGYEWYPTEDITTTTSRGVRILRRALNSMVLPTLFTHEYNLLMEPDSWRLILSGVTSALSPYNPEYKSMDDAVQYIRAKENINITNITDDNTLVSISCSGDNDMETKCYLFTGSDNQILFRLITLPMMNSVPITVGILK